MSGMNVPNCVFCKHFSSTSSPINTPRNCRCHLHGVYLPKERYTYLLCRHFTYHEPELVAQVHSSWQTYYAAIPEATIIHFPNEYSRDEAGSIDVLALEASP